MRENMAAHAQKPAGRSSGSLAWRVFAVSFLLLVIPLFLQDLFLYRQEYENKLDDVKEILDVIGKEREAAIEQRIQIGWRILDGASGDIEKYRKDFHIERICLPAGVTGDYFAVSSARRGALLIGKKESSIYALVLPVSFEKLIADLDTGSFPYPIRMALIDPNGKLLAENRSAEGSGLLIVKEEVPSADFNLLISVPKDAIRDLQKKTYFFRLAALVFFVGVIGGGLVWLLTKRIARPLNRLAKTMDRVAEGAVHARYTPDWMGFEINALGKRFNETLDAVLRLTEEADKERTARQKLAEEWRIGHDIQEGLFPKHLPGFKGLDVGAAHLSAKEVNGDFYDLFPLANGKVLIAIADSAGKGISACLFSLGLRSTLRSLATATDDLSEIVQRANDLFWVDARDSSMFASLWLGLYDPETRLLTYCSQGHPPAFLRRGKEIEELWTEGIALGAQKFDAVPTQEIELHPGDWLLLYTDGIIEAHNPENQLFGRDRLRKFLLAKKKESPQQWIDRLLKEINAFSQKTPQHDDMTLLLLHISH